MAVTNEEIAGIFENMAALLEMKGDVIFKIRAYHRAARTIERLPFSLEQAVAEGQELKGIPGIGEAIDKKIREQLATGRVDAYERLKAEFPDGVLSLINVPGVGPKTAMLIVKELGVSTVEGLEKAIQEGRLSQLPRIGEKTAENILRHIHTLRTKDQRLPLGRSLPVAEQVMAALRERCPGLGNLSPAGSLRRWKETVGDIDLMGTAENPVQVIDALVGLPMVREVLGHGPKKASVVVDPGLQIDLRIVDEDSYGALIQYFTGSKEHNVILRDYANRMGLSLNEYGISNLKTGKVEKFAQEEDFYARLGLQYVPPEIREGMWEVTLAAKNALPNLVEVANIKGDLHVHTNWSDGRDPVETMVEGVVSRGYQYVAITDHSVGRGIANGLNVERLRKRNALIRGLEDRYPIKLLCGSEVDIRADGSLDYPDELLSELDVVVASVHSAMGQDSAKMTERIIKAIRNPHVTIVGHPTCRLLGSREPIDVDMEALFRAAAETGTALEINASPDRLDLKDVHVMRARELGVPLVINTDAHTLETLDQMRFGVAVARRGWCQAGHILNTRSLEEFLLFLRTPKPERGRLLVSKV